MSGLATLGLSAFPCYGSGQACPSHVRGLFVLVHLDGRRLEGGRLLVYAPRWHANGSAGPMEKKILVAI